MAKTKMIISVEADTGKAIKGLNDVEKKLGKVEGAEKGVAASSGTMSTGFVGAGAAANTMTGGAVAGFTAVKVSILTGVAGLKTFRVALAATGIGLLVIAVGSLVAFFTKTRKGAELLEIATAAMGAVFGKLTDVASSLGGTLANLFTNPIESIKNFGKLIKEFVMDRITNLMDGLGFLGSAISKLFSGDFSGAMKDAVSGVKNLAMANPLIAATAIVVEKVAGAAKDMAIELTAAARAATRLQRDSINLRESQRELNVAFAEGRAQIRELQLISEDSTKTIEERIAASEKAGQIEQDLVEQRQWIASEELRIHNEQMAITESLEEDYDKRNELEVNLINIRTESARIQKSLLVKTQQLRKEEETNIAAHNKAIEDAELEHQQKLQKLRAMQQDAILSAEELESQKVSRKYLKLMDGLDFFSEEYQILLEKMGKEDQAIRDKFSKIETDAEQAVLNSKYEMAQKALGALMALNTAFTKDGEQGAKRAFERNKRLAQASAILNTYHAVSDALAKDAIFPGSRFIAAAAAGAMGLAQVIGIEKTEFSSSTLPDTPSPDPGLDDSAADTSQAPPSIDFGFLGEGAGAGGGIRAYVIAENVSNGLQANQKLIDQTTL